MVILAAMVLAAAVMAWPPRDRPWWTTSGAPALGSSASAPDQAERFGTGATHPWRWVRGRHTSRDDEELLVLLDAIAPALAAGLPPVAALAHLSRRGRGGVGAGVPRGHPGHPGHPVEALLADLVAEASAGRPLAPVWTRHAHQGGWGQSPEVAFVARAWSLSESLGSPLAECASVAARAVRQQSARRQRLAIALAGPRATASVLTALPLAGPVVGLLLGLSPRQLYATPVAAVSTLSGLALLVLGRWWCARLVAGIGRRRPAGGARPRPSPTARPSGWGSA